MFFFLDLVTSNGAIDWSFQSLLAPQPRSQPSLRTKLFASWLQSCWQQVWSRNWVTGLLPYLLSKTVVVRFWIRNPTEILIQFGHVFPPERNLSSWSQLSCLFPLQRVSLPWSFLPWKGPRPQIAHGKWRPKDEQVFRLIQSSGKLNNKYKKTVPLGSLFKVISQTTFQNISWPVPR